MKSHFKKIISILFKVSTFVCIFSIINPLISIGASGLASAPSGKQDISIKNFNQKILVLLVSFKDTKIANSPKDWTNHFFGNTDLTVNNYYNEVSNGKFKFSPAEETNGTVNDGIVSVNLNYKHPRTNNKITSANKKIVEDSLKAANQFINFKSFDTNNDGALSVDELHIVVVVAGKEASYTATKSASVWAHRWYTKGINLDTVSLLNNTYNGGYLEIGELHSTHMATIGIICHELAHDLGLPDLYDTKNKSSGDGVYSLMAKGTWGKVGKGYFGSSPSHLDAWSKIKLGFVTPYTPSKGTSTVLMYSDIQNYNVVKIPTTNAKEYFLIENREFFKMDQSLAGGVRNGGIEILHINESKLDAGNNDKEKHKLVDVEEADEFKSGGSKLDSNSSKKSNGLFYIGNSVLFDNTSKPNSNLYNGNPSGFELKVNSISSNIMSVTITR